MKRERLVQLGLLMLTTLCACGQPSPPRAASSAAIAPSISQTLATGASNEIRDVGQSVALSNRAVLIVSQARGVAASAVKLKFSDPMSGRFEIPIEGVRDLRHEAELLSKDFGTNIAVIVDEATMDGRLRTNYVFRNGAMRRTIAPVGSTGLPPGGRRMYVWPETSKLSPPTGVRLVQQPK